MTYSAEEIARGLEAWLKKCRDEFNKDEDGYITLDRLLDDVREDAAQGWLPWQKLDDA